MCKLQIHFVRLCCCSFGLFMPLSYGVTGPMAADASGSVTRHLRWLDSWDIWRPPTSSRRSLLVCGRLGGPVWPARRHMSDISVEREGWAQRQRKERCSNIVSYENENATHLTRTIRVYSQSSSSARTVASPRNGLSWRRNAIGRLKSGYPDAVGLQVTLCDPHLSA